MTSGRSTSRLGSSCAWLWANRPNHYPFQATKLGDHARLAYSCSQKHHLRGVAVERANIFDKEPGTGLPSHIENIGRNALDIIQPQLFFIRDQYFAGPRGALAGQRILGISQTAVDSRIRSRRYWRVSAPSADHALRNRNTQSVIDTHNHIVINDLRSGNVRSLHDAATDFQNSGLMSGLLMSRGTFTNNATRAGRAAGTALSDFSEI
jgi:hypothetical protein